MDLTVKFQQICQIVEDEYHIPRVARVSSNVIRQEERDFNTVFLKDCYQLNKAINEFKNEINDLRPKYLLIDQGDEEEKDMIDDETTIHLNKIDTMYKNLKKTSKLKETRDRSKLDKKFSIQSSDMKLYMETMIQIRASLMRYILENLENLTKSLTEMKLIRLKKKKQLNSLSQYTTTTAIPIWEETPLEEINQLSAVQLEELQQENHSLLISNKQDTLLKIGKLEKSIHEILNLQQELIKNVNEQNIQIDKIIDNSESTTSNLKMSNLQLNKLKNSINDSGNYLMYILVISGLMILLIDFIKP